MNEDKYSRRGTRGDANAINNANTTAIEITEEKRGYTRRQSTLVIHAGA